MSGLSAIMLVQLRDPERNLVAGLQAIAGTGLARWFVDLLAPPSITAGVATWAWIPFAFTIFGGTLGWVFEGGLLLKGVAFQSDLNRFTLFIQKIRFLNLAPVITTILFFVCALVVPDPSVRIALLFVAGAGCFGLGAALFFGGASALPLVILGTQAAQIVIVVASGSPVGSRAVVWILVAQALVQGWAFVVGTLTPLRSTGFHVLSTVSGVLLYRALLSTLAVDPTFTHDVAPALQGMVSWGRPPAASTSPWNGTWN
jgi:hypothetical protein